MNFEHLTCVLTDRAISPASAATPRSTWPRRQDASLRTRTRARPPAPPPARPDELPRGGRAARDFFAPPESTNVAKGPAALGVPFTLPPSFRCHWLAAEYIMTSLPAACLFRATQRGVHTALFCVSACGVPGVPRSPQGSFLPE